MSVVEIILSIAGLLLIPWLTWASTKLISIGNKLAYMDGSAPMVKLQVEDLQHQINDLRERVKSWR